VRVNQQANDPVSARAAVAEEHFRLLVESVKDYAIFLLDPDGNVASWNDGAHLIKGYDAQEIIGQHLSLFYTEGDRAARKPQRLLELATAEGRVEDEGWRVRKDGSRFWADVVITALRDAHGQLVGFAKVTRDLSTRRDMENRLREAEERLAATLYSIGDGVLATDEDARVTIINRVAQQLTGWSEEQGLGRRIDDVFHIINRDTRAPVATPIERVLKEGKIVGLANHTVLIARDGTERPIDDSGAPIRDSQQRIRGAVLVFRDVTAEAQAEEALRQSEERLRLMIASVRDYAIYMLDPEGRVVTWNAGAEQIKGYEEGEIIGAHFSRFFAVEDIAAGKPVIELETAARDGRFEDEAWRVRKDGSRFWANIIISAIRDASGRLIGFAKVTRDLTERRKAEEERLNLAQAREAVRLRDEFLSIASHELKTPLAVLQLQLQGILDRREAVGETLATKITKAARASDRLAELVQSLLDVSRITTGTITLEHESFDLVEVATEVMAHMSESARQSNCTVSLEAAKPVRGTWDRSRVAQILTNLLSNAFKYAAGSPVTIVVERQDQAARLEVRDAGPGLPSGDPSGLFEKFAQANDGNYHGGFGLGLYIAREIAEAHGGSIVANAAESTGARFLVTLPLQPPSGS
jgi:PAS domain S-box-containing protein